MKWPWSRRAPAKPPAPELQRPARPRITDDAIEHSKRRLTAPSGLPPRPTFDGLPQPIKGVLPAGITVKGIVGDSALNGAWFGSGSWAAFGWGDSFPGFQYLAELTQRPEFRTISQVLAEEMTRKGIILKGKGTEDRSKKISELTDYLDNLGLHAALYAVAEQDGFYGRSQIYLDIGDVSDAELSLPMPIDPRTIPKGTKLRLSVVEPYWSYPAEYDSLNPLSAQFFKPSAWYVMQKRVHRSRILTFIGRELPDILKPVYMFSGMSLSQLAMPYVDNWLRTRQSISNLIHSFSVMVLKTNMFATMEGLNGGEELARRIAMFNNFRDNSGTFMLDMTTEDFANVSAPLSNLHELQAQAQEQICSVAREPLVKYTGITPSGLNASSDGEIRVFYDTVHAYQEHLFTPNLETLIQIAQLCLWGEIEEGITFEYVKLWELDEAGAAAIEKTEADTADVLIQAGVIDPAEERERLAHKPASMWQGIDLSGPPPEPPEMPGEEGTSGEIGRPETKSKELSGA